MADPEHIFVLSVDKDFLISIQTSLLKIGFQVEGYSDPSPLLNAVQTRTPDIFILDLSKSSDTYPDLMQKLRSDPQFHSVPVIAFTDDDLAETLLSDGKRIDADVYLVKSITESLLNAQIRALLRMKKAEDQQRLNKSRVERLLKISQYEAESPQDFLDYALGEAISLTGSRYGYIYHYDDQKREFTLNSWSKNVMADCTITEPQTTYLLEHTGIWGEAVRQGRPIILNDFHAPHPLKRGFPEGHAPLDNFLTIPVYRKGRIAAVVGVANKQHDYVEEDIIQLKLMMDNVWGYLERQKLQFELRKSEEHYRLLFENSGFGISYFDLDGIFLDCNKTALDFFELSPENTIGKSAESVFGETLGNTIVDRIKVAVKKDASLFFEDQLNLFSGKKWFSSNYCVIKNEKSLPVGIQVISQEITEKKELERALASQAKFPQENPNPVLRVDQEGNILFSNNGAKRILDLWGCAAGRPVPEKILHTLQNCLTLNCTDMIELDVDGSVYNLFITPIPEFNYVNIYGSDITKLRHAQKELQGYSRNLEKQVEKRTRELRESQEQVFRQEKLAVLGKLSGGIAHELRNPLAVINSAAYFIGDHIKDDAEVSDCVEIIKDEVHNADHIISTLNNFARQKQPVRSLENISEMINTLTSHHPAPDNIQLIVDIPTSLPALNIDRQQILQAFTNLVNNAYQAMPSSGVLTISAKKIDNSIIFSFKDTGKGFSKEDVNNLYQPLYTSKPQGIGLGLPIVKMLIESHGGIIELKNSPGRGAEFLVSLPFK